MPRKIIAALAAASLLCATPAFAHWQNTRWGMTIDEVAKATGAKPDVGGPDDQVMGQDRKLSGWTTFEGRRYEAEFYFSEAGGLTLVRLAPLDRSQCAAIIAELKARHGPTANKYHGDWTDRTSGDGVFQSYSDPTLVPCYTTYRKPGI